MDVSCWSFGRMAELAEPLMAKGRRLFCIITALADGGWALQRDGAGEGWRWNRLRAIWPPNSAARHPRTHHHFTRAMKTRRLRLWVTTSAGPRAIQGARAQPGCRLTVWAKYRVAGPPTPRLMTWQTLYIDSGYHIID